MRRMIAIALVASTPALGLAQPQSGDLAKQLQNPIADLVSVPFQENAEFGAGPENAFRSTLNVQPVVPFDLGADWTLISRTIVPFVYREGLTAGADDVSGLGDITQSLFFSPRSEGELTWGVGPVLLLPTASEDALGADAWGLGPTGVVLLQRGPWTVGALANHLWSVAADDGEDLSATFIQPFASYTYPNGLSLTANTESTYDWKRSEWTVPLNLGVSKVTQFGRQPVSLGLQGKYYAEGPDSAPDWGVRLTLTLLFPSG